MQNYQSSFKKVSSNLRDHFDEFFLENDRDFVNPEVQILPQMPAFQRNLFLQRSLKQHLTVNLQLTLAQKLINVCGKLAQINADQFTVTTQTNVTYLLKRDDIRYIAQK